MGPEIPEVPIFIGNPENAGTSVATPTAGGVSNAVWQQWMCAMVAGPVKPLNVALTVSVWAVVSSATCARPVPVEGTGGVGRSFAKERLAKRSITSAWAAGAGRISTDANASRQDRIELLGSDSFMFASLAEELDTGCGCRLWRQV